MDNVTSAQGWAIEENGELLVATVSPTAVGAMVNWLVVAERTIVRHGATDSQVDWLFKNRAGPKGVQLRHVTIVATGLEVGRSH